MAFSTNGRNKGAMSEINVTPLVDVMLVLLIIFMVTAPMMQEGISVELPQARGSSIDKKSQVEEFVIAVAREGSVFVNDKPVEESKLVETILAAKEKNPATEVYLRADKEVPYGTVVRIMAALRQAGIADLGMITAPQEPTPGSR